MTRTEALDILKRCDIHPFANFYALSSRQVDALLVEADKRKYRKPAGAQGSRARYFFAYVAGSNVMTPAELSRDMGERIAAARNRIPEEG